MITMTCVWIGVVLIGLALVAASYNARHWIIGTLWIAIAICAVGFAYGVSEWMWRNMV